MKVIKHHNGWSADSFDWGPGGLNTRTLGYKGEFMGIEGIAKVCFQY